MRKEGLIERSYSCKSEMRNQRSAGIVSAARESPHSHSISHRIDHNKEQFLSRLVDF